MGWTAVAFERRVGRLVVGPGDLNVAATMRQLLVSR